MVKNTQYIWRCNFFWLTLNIPAFCHAISSILFPSIEQWSRANAVMPQAIGFLQSPLVQNYNSMEPKQKQKNKCLPYYICTVVFAAKADLNNRHVDSFPHKRIKHHASQKLKVNWHFKIRFRFLWKWKKEIHQIQRNDPAGLMIWNW